MPTNESEPVRDPPAAAVASATPPPPAASQLTGDDLGPPPAPALVQLGGYRIVGKLGEGGMGVVYQAVQLSLDRTVALKVIKGAFTSDRPFVARFLREARVAARIDHANVVAIYDTGEADGHLFTAQQFVPGGDLQQRLQKGGACSEDEALRIAAECGRGLRAIHLAGLVHRDIKPSNIFIAADGSVKIGDLGLVRSVLDDERLTYSGDLIGTPAYMSPEQALAESDVDSRTDLYALGASLYHLLTGQPPFGGKSPFLIGHQVLAEMAPDPRLHNPAISAETCAIVHHAMRKERSLRYQTADEMVEDLTRARARTPLRYARVAEMAAERRATLGEAVGAALGQGAGSSRRRIGPALLALAVVLSVACALAIGLRLASGPQPLPPPVLPAEEGFPAGQPPPAPESVAALPELILDHDGATHAAGEELARREAAAAPGGTGSRSDEAGSAHSRPQLLAANPPPAGTALPSPTRPAAPPPPRPAAQPAGVPDDAGAHDAGRPAVASAGVPPPVALTARAAPAPAAPAPALAEPAPAVPAPAEPPEAVVAPPQPAVPAAPAAPPVAEPPPQARARAGVPAWATRSGTDRFGPWVELEVLATKQRFRRCPAGSFLVGSPEDEEGREAGEGLHRVTLAQAFWLADTECTQLLWSSLMGGNPSSAAGAELPVDQVSWTACQEFCRRLGARAHGAHARLPSEAEWEAACRAGSRGPFSGGAEPAAVAWFAANSGAAMHLVATRQANSLGLYDCQGNVWEWCQECDPGYPDHPAIAGELVLRGGAWSSALRACRAASRNLRTDGEGFPGSGLRVVIDDQ